MQITIGNAPKFCVCDSKLFPFPSLPFCFFPPRQHGQQLGSSYSTRWCCSTAAADPAASEVRWIWNVSLLFLILKLLNVLLKTIAQGLWVFMLFCWGFFPPCFNMNSRFLGHCALCSFLTRAVRIEIRNKKKIDIHNKCN